jgi:hypothetical protein
MFAQSYACVDRKTCELIGLLVKRLDSLEFTYFTAAAKRDESSVTFTLSATVPSGQFLKDDFAFVSLPAFPYPQRAFTMLACASMGFARLPKSIVLMPDRASEVVMRQWMLLAFLDDFGVRLVCEDHLLVKAVATGQPASIVKPPFDKIPKSEDFQVDEVAPPTSDPYVWPIQIETYGAESRDDVIALMARDDSDAFDSDDVISLGEELKLSIRSDQLSDPLVAGNHYYASAEYWICLANSGDALVVRAFVGLLTFYRVENECWMGYLLECGAIMTEVALRRAKQRGFQDLLVWTTRENVKAQKFYLGIGFVEATDRVPRDHHGELLDCIAFQLAVVKGSAAI